MKKKNSILIVDDDSASLMELTYILRSEYKLYTVSDGTTALEKARESIPDLILLDVIMPDMNGFDVITELKKSDITESIPVIFITGLSEKGSESEGLAIGAVDFILKPFNAEVVKLRVSQQIKIINLQRDLINAAAAAEEAANTAEAANKSKSVFLANMSHEIRTPMNAIMGVTDILMQIEKLPDEIEDGLDMIYASSEMLLGIINDILDFSKIEAGKLEILSTMYKVAHMVNDAVHFNIIRIGNRPIKFELQIDENIPAELIGDELRIKQILNNLLSNAFKYTDAGIVKMTVDFESEPSVNTSTQKSEPYSDRTITLIIKVMDTGHGMTKEQLNKLFDEYSRFNENSKRTIEGTGLGLSIMKRLVNLMNGSVHVESEPDKGTIVTVRLPQGITSSNALGSEIADNLRYFNKSNLMHRKKIKFKRELMPYGKVLIVDDIETNLFVAVKLMSFYKLQIETAINGQEAVDKVKNGNEYDIIFMDHMMPEMDGIEATGIIREWEKKKNAHLRSKHDNCGLSDLEKRVPIVALTANAVAGQAEIFMENGFDAFLSKPMDVNQLDIILNKFIRDKQPAHVIEAALKLMKETAKGDKEKNDFSHIKLDSLLIDSFIKDAQKAVAFLEEQEQYIMNSSGNFDKYDNEEGLRRFITCVHGIKSSLDAVNETKLSKLAHTLEKAGREKKIDLIASETSGFLNELRQLLVKFEHEQNKNSGSNIHGSYTKKGQVNTLNMHEILCRKIQIIADMCEVYDRKGILEIIAEAGECPKEIKEILDKIKEYVIHSEFEEAQKEAVSYIANFSVPVTGRF